MHCQYRILFLNKCIPSEVILFSSVLASYRFCPRALVNVCVVRTRGCAAYVTSVNMQLSTGNRRSGGIYPIIEPVIDRTACGHILGELVYCYHGNHQG
jgi:hypothetical protein